MASFSNAAMVWGTETEPQARAAYAFEKLAHLDCVGFVAIPRLTWRAVVLTASSATMAWSKSSARIPRRISRRCSAVPSPPIHPPNAMADGLHGPRVFDFVSFDPRMPDHMQLFCKRLTRDNTYISVLEKKVITFLAELDDKIAQLKSRFATQEAAE